MSIRYMQAGINLISLHISSQPIGGMAQSCESCLEAEIDGRANNQFSRLVASSVRLLDY